MSELNTTPLDSNTNLLFHGGNPNLSDLETARELRAAREKSLADRVLEYTPRDVIDQIGINVGAARKHELETTITFDVAA